jgi:hypothetical protein
MSELQRVSDAVEGFDKAPIRALDRLRYLGAPAKRVGAEHITAQNQQQSHQALVPQGVVNFVNSSGLLLAVS